MERFTDYIRGYLGNSRLIKKNYKGKAVISAGGLFFITGLIIIWSFYPFFGIGEVPAIQQLIFLTAITGAAGLIDDLAGSSEYRGFRGHFRALLEGKLSSGFLKILFISTGVLLVLLLDNTGRGLYIIPVIIDLLLILLMTNLMNLFDLRPGRTLKFFLILSLPLFFQGNFVVYLLPVFILIAIYLLAELKGEIMLGDSGANIFGVILGLGYTGSFFIYSRLFILFILLFLNIASEKVSFTGVIEGNRFLKWFDKLGRID